MKHLKISDLLDPIKMKEIEEMFKKPSEEEIKKIEKDLERMAAEKMKKVHKSGESVYNFEEFISR